MRWNRPIFWLLLLFWEVLSVLQTLAQECSPPLGHVYTQGQPAWVPARYCFSIRGDSITAAGRYQVTGLTVQGWQVWRDTIRIQEWTGCLGFPLDSMRTGWFRVVIQSVNIPGPKFYFDYALLPAIDQTELASEGNPYGFNTQITETTAPLVRRSGAGWVHFEQQLTDDTNGLKAKVQFQQQGDSLIAILPLTLWSQLGEWHWGKGSERGISYVSARLIREYGLWGGVRAMRTPTELQNLDEDGFPRGIEHWQKEYAIRSRLGPFRIRVHRGLSPKKLNPYLFQFPPPDTVQTHAFWQGQRLPIRQSDRAVAWAARRRLASSAIRHLDSTTGWRIRMVEPIYEPGNFLFVPWPANVLSRRLGVEVPWLPVQAAAQKLIAQTDLGLQEAYTGKPNMPLLGAEGDIPMADPTSFAFFDEVLNGGRFLRPHPRLELAAPAKLPALRARTDAASLYGRAPKLGLITFHPYPGNAPSTFASNAAGTGWMKRSTLRDDVDSLRAVYARYTRQAGLPDAHPEIWATETGYPSGGSKILNQWQMNEERQARYLPAHLLAAFGAGVSKVMWYGFRDVLVYDRNGTFRNYDLMPQRMDASYDSLSAKSKWGEFSLWEKAGLVRATNTVKPAYAAFATLTRLLPDVTPNYMSMRRIGYQRLITYSWNPSVRALMKDDPQGDTVVAVVTDPTLPYHIYSAEGVLLSQDSGKREVFVPLHRDAVTYIVQNEELTLDDRPAIHLHPGFYPALPKDRNAKPQGAAWMLEPDSILGFAADSNLWEKPAQVRIALKARSGRTLEDTVLPASAESERGYLQLGLPGDHGFRFRIPQKWKTAARKGRRFEVFVLDAPSRRWRLIGQPMAFTPPSRQK